MADAATLEALLTVNTTDIAALVTKKTELLALAAKADELLALLEDDTPADTSGDT